MRFNTPEPAVAEVDMTPMIDIVFQLIAFFMLINNFEQTRVDERVKLPFDRLAQPPETPPEYMLVLNIGYERDAKTGDIISGAGTADERRGNGVLVFHDRRPHTIQLFDTVLAVENKVRLGQGQKIAEVPVTIRADAEVPWGKVQEVVAMAQKHGFQKFALRAKQPAGRD